MIYYIAWLVFFYLTAAGIGVYGRRLDEKGWKGKYDELFSEYAYLKEEKFRSDYRARVFADHLKERPKCLYCRRDAERTPKHV